MAKEPKNLEPNMFVHSSSGSFTTMRNYHLRDTSISLKACGLLSKMLSLPPDWNFTIEGLASLTRDGRDSVNAAIKELKEHGYISTSPKYGTDGRFCGVRYDIYESPHPENPDTVSPDTEKPNTENPQVLNTNKLITNELSTNEPEKKDINSVPSFISKEKEPDAENPQLDKPKRKKKEYTYINPSREEVEAYIKEQGLHITYESMYGYYFNEEKGGWAKKDGTPVLNWKGTCWTFEGHWKERNKGYEDKRKDFSVSAGRVLSPEAERERQRSLEQMRMLEQRRKERERNAVNE